MVFIPIKILTNLDFGLLRFYIPSLVFFLRIGLYSFFHLS